MPVSGYMDPVAAQFANYLVGNFEDVTLIEFSLGGVRLQAIEDVVISVVGAGEMNRTYALAKGEVITIPASGTAVWGYIGIHGGWSAKNVLASCSYYSRADMGQSISVGDSFYAEGKSFSNITRSVKNKHLTNLDHDQVVRISKGPHYDLVENADDLLSSEWFVSQLMDRTGYRLDGAKLRCSASISSLPVIPGCIQVTPSGQPIITMLDGPTVGGYPIVVVVDPVQLGNVAQRQSGNILKFKWYDIS